MLAAELPLRQRGQQHFGGGAHNAAVGRVAPEHEATLVSLRRTRSRKAGAREHAADTASNPTSGEGAVNDNAAE